MTGSPSSRACSVTGEQGEAREQVQDAVSCGARPPCAEHRTARRLRGVNQLASRTKCWQVHGMGKSGKAHVARTKEICNSLRRVVELLDRTKGSKGAHPLSQVRRVSRRAGGKSMTWLWLCRDGSA